MHTARLSVVCLVVCLTLAGCDQKPIRPSSAPPKATKVELPEFYGVYAAEGGKLLRMEPGTAPESPLDAKSAFVVYDRVLGASAMGASVDDIVRLKSEGVRVSVATKPLDKPDMVMLVPVQPIVSGSHTLHVASQEYPFRVV